MKWSSTRCCLLNNNNQFHEPYIFIHIFKNKEDNGHIVNLSFRRFKNNSSKENGIQRAFDQHL